MHTAFSHAVDSAWLKNLCKAHGADDVGVVELARPALAAHVKDVLYAFGGAASLVCLAKKIHPPSVRSPASYVKDVEFSYIYKELVAMNRRILVELARDGIQGLAESGVFPFNSAQWPGKMWTLPLKTLAVEAGLGHMGMNRLVLHPEFGAFVCFSALIIDAAVNTHDSPLPEQRAPCLRCKLCLAACPTGAIREGDCFGFVSCATHNYRDRLGGFIDWSERIAASRSRRALREAVSDQEAVSMWQSLFCGAGTKCDYCMAVCPAGLPHAADYARDKRGYYAQVVRALVEKPEEVFVVPGSDADFHCRKKASAKIIRYVSNGLRPASAAGFLTSLPLVFQREPAAGLSARYHFTFTGSEELTATVCIEGQSIRVLDGLDGRASCAVIADSQTWIRALAGRKSMLLALLTRKIRVAGSLRLLKAFQGCFPNGG